VQALALAILLAAGAPEKPKLIVLDLAAQTGVDDRLARALTDAVANEVASRGFFQTSSSRDIQTLLGVERQRQLLGCDESGCMSELAGALGARFVLNGSLARLGDAYQLSLQLLDSQRAGTVRRSMHLAKDLDGLRAQLPTAVAEVTGTPLPPAPSHLVPYALMGGGAVAVTAAAVVGLLAVTSTSQYQKELSIGVTTPSILKTYSYYTQAKSQLGAEWGVAIGAAAVGAVLVGVGLYVNPAEPGSSKVALAPGPQGVALVGTW
jgi:TolB-like protein